MGYVRASVVICWAICSSGLIAGCASAIPRPQPFPDRPYTVEPQEDRQAFFGASKGPARSEVKHFLEMDTNARKTGTDVAANLRYLNAGLGLADTLCNEWFASLEATRQTAEFRQGTSSLTGTLTGTLMSLFNSATKEIGAAAAVFGGVNGWYNLGKTTFFLTPKLGTVQNKLAELRQSMADSYVSDAAITASYERSYRALERYMTTCGTLEVQRFIDTATDIAKYEYTPAGGLDPGTSIQLGALTTELLKAVSWPVTNAKISASSLKELYFLRFEQDLATKMGYPKDTIAAQLNASYPADGAAKTSADRLLASIGSLLDVQKDVQQARTAAESIESDTAQKVAEATKNGGDGVSAATRALEESKQRQLHSLGVEISAKTSAAPAEIRIVPAH